MNGPAPLTPRRLFPWLALTAFASGVPNALVTDTAPLLYRSHGVDLTDIGLFSIVTLGWPLKLFLAPLVDRFGGRRTWMLLTQLALAGLLVLAATLPADSLPWGAWACFMLIALVGGLQDVAVDGYAVDATAPGLLGPAGGVRAGFYRLAVGVAGGALVGRAQWLGWSGIWQTAAGLMALLACASWFLPRVPRTMVPQMHFAAPIASLLKRPGSRAFLLFVLLYKVGDRAMAPMTKAMLQDEGFTLEMIGNVYVPLLILATMAGALLGGWLTRRWGVMKALVILGLAQALSNLAFAGAAAAPHPVTLWGAAAIEPFCGGLGSAPFVALLMGACSRSSAATQYAFLTAVMGLVGGTIGVSSGHAVETYGYAKYFAATCFLALPPLLLLPWVRQWLATPPEDQDEAVTIA